MQNFLRMKAVVSRTGLSRSTIYSRIKDGTFPEPVKIGPRASAWPSDAIDAWQQKQIAAGWSPVPPIPRSKAA